MTGFISMANLTTSCDSKPAVMSLMGAAEHD